MPDYIYLLENRLSQNQQNALRTVRDTARDAQMTVFLTGSAVRDLTIGSSVRELEFSVQGDIRKLKEAFATQGVAIWGEDDASRTLFLSFPGAVRVEVSSSKTATYAKPGVPSYHWASILEDLRHRDFTANAMALSLNEGSYGLLMDPLNGVADIEARTLRLVSNYGFLENPILLARVIRLKARLAWELDEKTAQRYENAKAEEVFNAISDLARSLELEEIAYEEDALKVITSLEEEGWMQKLFPAWTSAVANTAELEKLHELLVKLQLQGVNPNTAAASMVYLTAKMPAKDLDALKASFVRKGFVEKWNSLDAMAKQFSQVLLSKDNASPSSTWNLFTSYDPEAILWLGLTTKSNAVEEKFNNFFTTWPEVRQKVPYAIMQEMRIIPELEGYQDLVQKIFLELIDGRLKTAEEIREFLKPYSPPAPPPPVTIKRSRGGRKALAELKMKADEEDGDSDSEDEDDIDLHDEDGDFDADSDHSVDSEVASDEEEEISGFGRLDDEESHSKDDLDDEDEDEDEEAPVKKPAAPAKPAKKTASSHKEEPKEASDSEAKAPAKKASSVSSEKKAGKAAPAAKKEAKSAPKKAAAEPKETAEKPKAAKAAKAPAKTASTAAKSAKKKS